MEIGALIKSGQKSLRESSLQGLEVPLPHKPPALPAPDILLQSRTEIIAQRKLSYLRLVNLPLSLLLPWFPTLSPTDQCLSIFGRWGGEFTYGGQKPT